MTDGRYVNPFRVILCLEVRELRSYLHFVYFFLKKFLFGGGATVLLKANNLQTDLFAQ